MTVHCDVCHGELDQDRLRSGPLARVCLECLTDEQRSALQHDLDAASQVQLNMLPARNFTFGGWQIHYEYQPLGAVSGDHIDLIRPDRTGEALHFLFGDVAGKGVAASILMANLQALFRSLVSLELPLPEIVGRANELFSDTTAANAYATLVAGRLNGSGSLELINAGHNPPLLVRESSVCPLNAAALPLGFARHTRFELEQFLLEPEDFLFLYTDGVSEAVDRAGEEYGSLRVSQAVERLRGVAAERVVDSVLDGVHRFQNGTAGVDDVTAMAIRWRG